MRLLIVLTVFCLYTFLFYKAAGSLSLKRLNLTGYAYYLILIFGFIGASCVFCGFRDHYLIAYVSEATVDKTYMILCYTVIVMPLTIWVCNILFGVRNMKASYAAYMQKPTETVSNNQSMFVLVVALGAICIASMVYVFSIMGYFPPLAYVTKTADELSYMRIQDTRGFTGNSYIRDLIMRALTPIVSYVAYVYMRKTKEAKWMVLFAVLFVASLIVKTYNFEKAPVMYYVIYLYIIEIMLGNIKSLKALYLVAGFGGVLIFFFYYVISGYQGDLFTISTGPGGRIFMTQIATMFLHVEAFPEMVPFLEGTSLPGIFADFLGLSDSWVRSGGVVMGIFKASAVEQGIAGVMNSLFAAEAWANWGVAGVAVAPVLVGFLFSASTCFLVKCRKSPAMMIIYIILFINFSQALLGGFVDYIYPLTAIVLVVVIGGVELLSNRGSILFRAGKPSHALLHKTIEEKSTEE